MTAEVFTTGSPVEFLSIIFKMSTNEMCRELPSFALVEECRKILESGEKNAIFKHRYYNHLFLDGFRHLAVTLSSINHPRNLRKVKNSTSFTDHFGCSFLTKQR